MNNSELLYKDIYHPLYKNTYPPFLRSFLRRKLLIVTEINDCNETNITKHIETLKNCDRYVIVENIKVTHKVTNDPDCVNHDLDFFARMVSEVLGMYFNNFEVKTNLRLIDKKYLTSSITLGKYGEKITEKIINFHYAYRFNELVLNKYDKNEIHYFGRNNEKVTLHNKKIHRLTYGLLLALLFEMNNV